MHDDTDGAVRVEQYPYVEPKWFAAVRTGLPHDVINCGRCRFRRRVRASEYQRPRVPP